jgi:SsrA-binding protein
MARDTEKLRIISTNRKAFHHFIVLDELVCGIELVGTEVKSLRDGNAVIGAAYGQVRNGELYLMGASIPEYSHGNLHNHKPERERRLLAKRREIDKWYKQVREKGVTIVPLDIHFEGHLVKVKMALVRGKKLYDKRAADKAKSMKQDMRRALGRQR